MSRQVPRGAAQQSAEAEAAEAQPDGEAPEYIQLDRRRALHAFDWGALAGALVALAYGALWGAAVLQFGLIAVAIMGGWLIGAGVRHGAWRGVLHLPDRRLKLLAGGLSVAAWLGGAFVAYLVSRILLPDSALDFAQRLAALPFNTYLNQQYEAGGPVHAIALAAMVIMGWRTAR